MLGPRIFSGFINDLHNRTECTLSKFVTNMKWGREAGILECRVTEGVRYGLTGTSWSSTKVQQNKCQVLHLGWKTSLKQCGLGADWLKGGTGEKDLGALHGHQSEHEPEMCPHSNKGWSSPGLTYQECCQHVLGSDSSLLYITCKITSAVLYLVFNSSQQ